MKYDILIVGSGLFAAVVAHQAKRNGMTCCVIDRREHIGGNCYTETVEGIEVHKYGAHIFRTGNKAIWNYISQFDEFNNFINSPIANFNGELFNLPFNMNTFHQMWGISSPSQAKSIIANQRKEITHPPRNLEEKAISLVGKDIYEKLIKGYTEKQWGRKCNELPSSIIRRIPVRFTYDNNYFNEPYQGIPKHGYTHLISKMFEGCDIILSTDFNLDRGKFIRLAKKVLYTGPIDELYDFCYGPLEYRSLKFEHHIFDVDNLQGVAVMNFTDSKTPYTRRIEHKHFVFGTQEKTVVSYEYPLEWKQGIEPYYPINDDRNQTIYKKYLDKSLKEDDFFIGGRLGEYKYYDMQDTIKSAFEMCNRMSIPLLYK